MQAGLRTLGVAVVLWLLGDALRLLSPAESVSGFQSLSGLLSALEALAHAVFLVGAAQIAISERSVPLGLAALGAAMWCVGWAMWNLDGPALPIHPDLLTWGSVSLLCLTLLRWLNSTQRLLPVLAALLAGVPFAAAIAQGTGFTLPATGYFSAQLLGELALLAALWLARQR